MMRSIAPFWDGNETWLVLGGGGLWVAFPHAYAVIMPALYLPVIVMLLALVFRGVAFEFRHVSRSKTWWNFAFTAGSTLAAFSQGRDPRRTDPGHPRRERRIRRRRVRLGDAVRGAVRARRGRGLCAARRDMAGDENRRPGRRARPRPGEDAAARGAGLHGRGEPVDALVQPAIAARWFSLPNILYLWPVPVVTALIAFGAWRALEKGREVRPFVASIAMFLLGYLGLVISWFPYLVPPSLTVWQAAAVPASQIFMLIGTLVFLPLALTYTALVYWLFRGKVRPGESYH